MNKNLIIVFLTLAVLLSGCTAQKTDIQGTKAVINDKVAILKLTFFPTEITINKGTNVTWTNMDNAPHTVTGIGNVFNSGTLNKGQTYSYTFIEPGTFEYECSINPSMRGKVIVT